MYAYVSLSFKGNNETVDSKGKDSTLRLEFHYKDSFQYLFLCDLHGDLQWMLESLPTIYLWCNCSHQTWLGWHPSDNESAIFIEIFPIHFSFPLTWRNFFLKLPQVSEVSQTLTFSRLALSTGFDPTTRSVQVMTGSFMLMEWLAPCQLFFSGFLPVVLETVRCLQSLECLKFTDDDLLAI